MPWPDWGGVGWGGGGRAGIKGEGHISRLSEVLAQLEATSLQFGTPQENSLLAQSERGEVSCQQAAPHSLSLSSQPPETPTELPGRVCLE